MFNHVEILYPVYILLENTKTKITYDKLNVEKGLSQKLLWGVRGLKIFRHANGNRAKESFEINSIGVLKSAWIGQVSQVTS